MFYAIKFQIQLNDEISKLNYFSNIVRFKKKKRGVLEN